jgi:cyclase
MLAHRVIPVMLQRGSMLVKGRRFCSWRNVGHAQQAVAIHQARGVDELIYLDIGATPAKRGPDFAMVRRLTEGCFMPITVGGGVRTVDDVRGLLDAGADKIAVKTAWREVLEPAAAIVGCQAMVLAIDYDDGEVVTWALEAQDMGAGEILLTSMYREGSMQGYDLDMIKRVTDVVDIPVIAHGGCGSYEHMAQAIRAGASAVAAGSLFQFTDSTPKEAAEYLQANGIEART